MECSSQRNVCIDFDGHLLHLSCFYVSSKSIRFLTSQKVWMYLCRELIFQKKPISGILKPTFTNNDENWNRVSLVKAAWSEEAQWEWISWRNRSQELITIGPCALKYLCGLLTVKMPDTVKLESTAHPQGSLKPLLLHIGGMWLRWYRHYKPKDSEATQEA